MTTSDVELLGDLILRGTLVWSCSGRPTRRFAKPMPLATSGFPWRRAGSRRKPLTCCARRGVRRSSAQGRGIERRGGAAGAAGATVGRLAGRGGLRAAYLALRHHTITAASAMSGRAIRWTWDVDHRNGPLLCQRLPSGLSARGEPPEMRLAEHRDSVPLSRSRLISINFKPASRPRPAARSAVPSRSRSFVRTVPKCTKAPARAPPPRLASASS